MKQNPAYFYKIFLNCINKEGSFMNFCPFNGYAVSLLNPDEEPSERYFKEKDGVVEFLQENINSGKITKADVTGEVPPYFEEKTIVEFKKEGIIVGVKPKDERDFESKDDLSGKLRQIQIRHPTENPEYITSGLHEKLPDLL